MKKAFTLIELITVIVLIGIIGLIAMPVVTNTMRQNKDKLYTAQLQEIREATEKWGYKNIDLLPDTEDESISINLIDLKREGFISLDIKNPKTGELLPNDMIIKITYKNNKYIYEVDGDSGTNITDEYNINAPTIVLNGNNIEYVEMNNEYVELGASAKDSSGNDVSVNIQYKDNEEEIPDITTGEIKSFTVVYSATSTIGEESYTAYIVRTVIVRDKTAPELTIPSDITINKNEVGTFDLLLGTSAIDNSGEIINIKASGYDTSIGKHVVSYEACDSNNNCITKKRIINIID